MKLRNKRNQLVTFRDDMANIRLVVVFNKEQYGNAKRSRQGILRKAFTSTDVTTIPTKAILRMELSIKQQSTFDESALPPTLSRATGLLLKGEKCIGDFG